MKVLELKPKTTLMAMLAALLTACGEPAPDMTTPPPRVAVLAMAPQQLALTDELTGRVTAVRIAEIRPQVNGIIVRRLFEQGSEVRAGQPLFQINAAPFKADSETAAASLRRAQAVLARATTQVTRLAPLVETDAISRQVYDDAVSQRDQATAEVAQARSELARRQLDLKFATVDAPISGRIDQAQVSEGALVSSADPTPLARIQQTDQVYVDVRQPAAELDSLRVMAKTGETNGKKVSILRSDGTPYGLTGRILFSGISVDEGTGDVLVRVLVENREHRLLPGMFVRASVERARFADALAVPQQAVVHSGGQAKVWVLGEHNKVRAVPVQLGELIGDNYRIRAGLKAGDQVVVEGLDRMAAGAQVTPAVWPAARDQAVAGRAVPTTAAATN